MRSNSFVRAIGQPVITNVELDKCRTACTRQSCFGINYDPVAMECALIQNVFTEIDIEPISEDVQLHMPLGCIGMFIM